jgi:hypothetical protein
MSYDPSLSVAKNVKRLIPPGAKLASFIPYAIDQIFLLLVMAVPRKEYFISTDQEMKDLPGEIWHQIIFFLVFGMPNRGIDPVHAIENLIRSDLNSPWMEAQLFGSSMVNRIVSKDLREIPGGSKRNPILGGNWYPENWNFYFTHVKDRTLMLNSLLNFLGLKMENATMCSIYLTHSQVFRVKINIGPYKINISERYGIPVSIDLDESGILYKIDTKKYITFEWDDFPGRYFCPTEFTFNYIDPELVRYHCGKDMSLPGMKRKKDEGFVFITLPVEDFLLNQEKRYLKYQDRIERRDGRTLIKNMITYPIEMMKMIRWWREYCKER